MTNTSKGNGATERRTEAGESLEQHRWTAIRVERVAAASRVALLTLDRPQRMNAWAYAMNEELTVAIQAINDDPSYGAMVLTGAGRAFCAGADMQDTFNGGDRAPDMDRSERPQSVDWVELLRSSKPIIAAVNGASVGVGATMILPCDVIIAAESARFAMGFIKMGLVPELASSHFLVQRLGFGRASEMCLTGERYSAADASAMGLVDHLVADDALLERATELAGRMAANPSRQLRWAKELLTINGSETDLKAVQRRELARLDEAFASAEHKEAVAAFLEKRAPQF
ncbi:MAG: enoyl-CoA hydratase-related protein [Pseudomonadota bacterium]